MVTLTGTTDDSGGPLINKEGRLVGIVEGTARGPMSPNVTLALDVLEIRTVLTALSAPPPDPPSPPDTGPAIDPGPPDPPGPPDTGTPADLEELYKKVVDSAVFIVTPMKFGHAEGSGSLVDKEKRLVITNYHVVADADKIYVQFPVHLKDGSILTDKKKYIQRIPDGQAIKGTVLHRDKTRDLAIVQLDRVPATARPIVLARTSEAAGTTSFNIGRPGAVAQVFGITKGSVRAVGIEDFVVGDGAELLRIKAKVVTATNPVGPGDSGGPLVNKLGELVAVTEASRTGVQQVNRFIDVTEVRAFLAEKKIFLKEDGAADDPTKPDRGPDLRPPAKPSDPFRLPDPPAAKDGGTVPAPSAETERSAAQALSRAKLFAEGDDNRGVYINKLKDVISKYPDTAAGREAKKLLDAAMK